MKPSDRKRVSGKSPRKGAFKSNGEKKPRARTAMLGAQTRKPNVRVQSKSQPLKAGNSKRFPIVGVGASAGGLEAFSQLLQNLPVDTGMAFVLVQHLDPGHESVLTQLLARTTSMPVTEVTNGIVVAPNRVYVIPPKTNMILASGVLKLQPRDKAVGVHRSIDFFFESLAQDQRERAIGVILSGTATDGTQGLEMIKSEGGFTFAQDQTSKFDSMPRSAVAAGCVDLVLSPKEIASELARIANHPLVANGRRRSKDRPSFRLGSPATEAEDATEGDIDAATPLAATENAFKRILVLLRNHRGVDFSLYKSNTIERRITRRMVLNKQEGMGDYARFLKGNLKELDLLYADVFISVTSFFRNPEAFEALKLKVFPALLQNRRRDDPVRVWTLGCSTGQEVYSIAMAFAEFCDKIQDAPPLQIFGTDLNEPLLEKARTGLYTRTLASDISPERLRRFFVEEQGGYRICKPLREMCVFARQNILSDPPFSRMDLISCRNVMIYIELRLQKKILSNFHYALKPGGFLFLGASESIGTFTNLFEPADKKQKIFAKKPGPVPAYFPAASQPHPAISQRHPAVPQRHSPEGFRTELDAQREADRVVVNQYAPPSVLINADLEVLQFRGPTRAFLEPPTGKASFNILKMARAGLMLPLRAAINQAKKKNDSVSRKNVRLDDNGRTRPVNIEVIPLKNLKERCYLILFEEVSKFGRPDRSTPPHPTIELRGGLKTTPATTRTESRRVTELERELAEAREYAQSLQEQHEAASEELQASSEEIQSANEELQSTNEELETSKEELESTNEELTTVNEEMGNRNAELIHLNSDLINLQTSTKLPIVLLGRDLSIRRFSPQAEKQFNLMATDVGRPFGNIRHNLDLPDLEAFIADIIIKAREGECEVRDKQGRWHILHVLPYLALDNKVDGAVLVLVDINAIKESEQAVIAARDFAEAIIRTARDPFLILDAGLRVEKANEAFYTTFKISPAESVGRTIFELDHGQWDIPKLRELLQDILPRHSSFNAFEVTSNFESIGHRTMLLNARTLSETKGQPARILLGIQDVSELLHFQAEMRRSELRYRRLFEAGKDGVLIIDPATRKIIDANPFMSDLLGYPHEALLGKELFEIGLLKDEEASRMAFQELQKVGFIRYENLPLETRNGRRREVEFVSNLYQEGAGKVIQCNIRDITERKQAEEALRQSEERYRTLFSSMDEGFCVIEMLFDESGKPNDYRFLEVNPSFENQTGMHKVVGKRMREIAPDLEAYWFEIYGKVVQTGKPVRYVNEAKALNGWFDVYAFQLEGPESRKVAVLFRNVTERKKADEALREAQSTLAEYAGRLEQAVSERTRELTATNKQLEAFVYSIAHDLRAPLRSMQGFSAMLVEEAGTTLSETCRGFAHRISASAQFMDALLLDLLAFSAIAQQRVELTSVNLESVVQVVFTRLEKEIHRKNARIEVFGSCAPVLAHEPTLGQVLFNLVSNALKFVDPTVVPLVRLRVEERAEFIRVWVEDNGTGIAPAHQEQIFKLFTRLHGDKFPGTGIGLAIVQKGMERMGGQLGVESILGQGSRFWLELRKA